MARLSATHQAGRERLRVIASRPGTPERVAAGIGAVLAEAIGWDGFRLFGLDPATRLVNRVLASSEGDDGPREEWFRDVYLRSGQHGLPFVELPWLQAAGVRAAAFQSRLDACFGLPDEVRRGDQAAFERAFHLNGAPVGGTILASFPVGSRWVAAMQAYRRDPGRPFRVTDVSFVQLVAPLIGEAIAAALSREQAAESAADRTTMASGIVVVQRSGAVAYASPAGEAWLDAMRARPGEGRHPVPSAVYSAMAGLTVGEGRMVTAVDLPGGRATIEATPGGDDAIALVISPVRPEPSPVVPTAWGLSPAEGRVVGLVVSGRTNQEIADQLSVSANTVEWHLRNVYERLGIRSRGQLAARYFHDAHLPSLTTG